jgi:hypothetical protein
MGQNPVITRRKSFFAFWIKMLNLLDGIEVESQPGFIHSALYITPFAHFWGKLRKGIVAVIRLAGLRNTLIKPATPLGPSSLLQFQT